MKIAIAVHGRFHAFDLARALDARGHDVTVLTNYPRWAAARFGLAPDRVRSFAWHGGLTRAAARASVVWPASLSEPWLHRLFGRWAAREVARESWDVVHCWSGVSEELLALPRPARGLTLLMRGSAHIRTQDALLAEEAARAGAAVERPSPWMIAREMREYALADQIVVLSSFARRTFTEQGLPPSKVSVLPLGVEVSAFRPGPEAVQARSERIRRGGPLQILYVGALSYQKGLLDLLRVTDMLSGEPFEFTLVGPVTEEVRPLLSTPRTHVRILGKRPQHELPAVYRDADLFVFPTIQDGFGMVLTQAKAGGLPILATSNCAGDDLIAEGQDGWVLPIRAPQAFADRLRWCHLNRAELARMADRSYASFRPRDWSEVAADFEGICEARLAASRSAVS